MSAWNRFKHAARWLLLIPALLPAGCHYAVTGPALFAHHSSAAFNMWLWAWLCVVMLPAWLAFLLANAKPKAPKA